MDTCFEKVVIPKVPNLIVSQIRRKIVDGELMPGERLPSEPRLQELFGVSRPQLKAAIKRMEEYGIVETRPQSGTFVAAYDPKILEGLLTNILMIDENDCDPLSLIDTRRVIENRAAELAVRRMTDEHFAGIAEAHEVFVKHSAKSRAVEDDIYFHLLIVNASESPVLRAQYCFLMPKMIDFWKSLDVLPDELPKRSREGVSEHQVIVEALRKRDPEMARAAMEHHMDSTYGIAEVLVSKGFV